MSTIPNEAFTQTILSVFVEHAVQQDNSGSDRHNYSKPDIN